MVLAIQLIENKFGIINCWRFRRSDTTFKAKNDVFALDIGSTRSGLSIIPVTICITAIGIRCLAVCITVGFAIQFDLGQIEVCEGHTIRILKLDTNVFLGGETAVEHIQRSVHVIIKKNIFAEEQQVISCFNINSTITCPNKLFGVFVNSHTFHINGHRTCIVDFNEFLMVLAIQLIENKIGVITSLRSWRSDTVFDHFVFRITRYFNEFVVFSFHMEFNYCS